MTTPRLKNVTPHSDAGQEATHLDEVHYPIDDDEPLAESEYQLFPLTYAHSALNQVSTCRTPTRNSGHSRRLSVDERLSVACARRLREVRSPSVACVRRLREARRPNDAHARRQNRPGMRWSVCLGSTG